jgi:hypothetical protein
MYSEHGFEPLIRPAVGAGVPVVDRGIELHARIAAEIRAVGDHAQHFARLVVSHTSPDFHVARLPLAVFDDRPA